MVADPLFFRDLAYVIVAALVGGGLAWLVRQPLILGYVVGGLLVSPLTPGPAVSDLHTFELLAEIGVVLLMFSIGIEFSVRDLLRVKAVALLGGPLGIALTVGLTLAVGTALGWPTLQATVIGLVVSVASTMVLARLLLDRGELRSTHGRVMVGITLVEDLIVVVLTVLMPIFGAFEPGRLLALGVALAKAAAILVPFWYVATRLLPPLLIRVARTGNHELFLLVTLAAGIGTAALAQEVGLSLALGAFLAGLIINESDYAHETLARLLPLRDTFVALFFVTVGALIDPGSVGRNVPLLGVIVGLVVVGKLAVWTLVVWIFRYPLWTALLVAVGLTQIGEFSYILVQAARAAGHLGADVYNATLAASLVTILMNAMLVRYVPVWIAGVASARQGRELPIAADEPHALRDHVLLLGFGRVGSAVGEALDTFGARYVVLETDPDVVKALQARGIPCLFGDGSHPHLAEVAGAHRARLAVVTIPEIDRADRAVRNLKRTHPGLPVLARANDQAGAERLERDGATKVVRPELEGAAALIMYALGHLLLPRDRVLAYLDRFREAMETAHTPSSAAPDPLPQVREVMVGSGTIADQSLRAARIRERFGVTVVAIARADGGDVLLNPPAETILRPGDRVRLFGLPEQIRRFAEAAKGS